MSELLLIYFYIYRQSSWGAGPFPGDPMERLVMRRADSLRLIKTRMKWQHPSSVCVAKEEHRHSVSPQLGLS